MKLVRRPLNVTREVTLLTAATVFVAGLAAYLLASLAGPGQLMLFAVLLAACSIAGALAVGLIVRSRQRDLWLLAIAARRMGEGDLKTPIRTSGKVEEVYYLAHVLEQSRNRISAMLAELAAAKEWSDSQRSVQAYFLGNISHEFRTPLAGMKVSLELLLDNLRTLSRAELDELLNSLHMSVGSMSQLIDNLLESSKIEAEQLTLRRVQTDIETLIADAARLAQPFYNRRGQQLTLYTPLTPVCVYVDATRIVQVLVNLLVNASKYSPAGGTVDIAVEGDVDQPVRIAVADRGSGIPAAERDGVFKRFVRLGTTEAEDYSAGLGLSVVKAIVELHGGSVGVDARDGGGSIFWFSLPSSVEVAGNTATAPSLKAPPIQREAAR